MKSFEIYKTEVVAIIEKLDPDDSGWSWTVEKHEFYRGNPPPAVSEHWNCLASDENAQWAETAIDWSQDDSMTVAEAIRQIRKKHPDIPHIYKVRDE